MREFAKLFPELEKMNAVLIHRIPPDMQISFGKELKEGQCVGETFMIPRPGSWDSEKIGAGAPPLRTRYGWLQIYHGVGEKDGERAYRLGVVLSDIEDPKKVIYRSPNPIIEPGGDDETEEEGWYQRKGWVPNVVFTCGAVPKYKDSTEILEDEDEVLVYYGCADEVICVAEAKVSDLIPEEVRKDPKGFGFRTKPKIAVMGSWNTDGGVSRHATPIVEWLRDHGYHVRVFTHYREAPHGRPLDVEDEWFVTRCYATAGREVEGLPPLDPEPLIKAIEEEGINLLLLEDLGMLPCEQILKILPDIKSRGVKVALLNHDNKPKPKDHIFWKCIELIDAVIDFLPEQDEFMSEFCPRDKIYLSDFPCYPVIEMDAKEARRRLGLPEDKRIIITFGEYDFIAPFKVLDELRKDDPSIYLIALVYDEEEKEELKERLRILGFERGYDDIRVENSSWMRRAEYVAASNVVVLDKGEKVEGEGAVLSSTCFQVIGWGTPIIARENKFFAPFKGEVLKYRDDEGEREAIRLALNDIPLRERLLLKARGFAYRNSPGRVATKIVKVFEDILEKPFRYPPCEKLRRFPGNPIIKPRPDVEIEVGGRKIRWERLVYNAGAVRIGGITYILYRALGYDGISRIGLAWSRDGLHIDGRPTYPIFRPDLEHWELPEDEEGRRRDHLANYGMCREIGGCEDPRLTIIEDKIYITYTAYGEIPQLALAKIDVEDFLRGVKEFGSTREWMEVWRKNGPVFYPLDDKDGILFPNFGFRN
jgi:predicted GH43/DUF377 family glycosyl hydrolase